MIAREKAGAGFGDLQCHMSLDRSFKRSPLLARKNESVTRVRVFSKDCLRQRRNPIHAAMHIGHRLGVRIGTVLAERKPRHRHRSSQNSIVLLHEVTGTAHHLSADQASAFTNFWTRQPKAQTDGRAIL